MKFFDTETQKRLLKVLNEDSSPALPPSSYIPPDLSRRTAPKPRKMNPSKPMEDPFTTTLRPPAKTTWAYTGDMPTATGQMTLPDMSQMADPRTQVSWAKYKEFVDPVVDYQLGIAAGIAGLAAGPFVQKFVNKKFGINVDPKTTIGATKAATSVALQNPITAFAIKQLVKTDLASRYMGAGGLAHAKLADLAKNQLGVDPNFAQVAAEAASDLVSELPGVGGMASTTIGTVTKTLGVPSQPIDDVTKAIADKLPELAKMGIDPLDWSTQLMGADEAKSNIEKIPLRGRSTRSAGGYLLTGQQKGIY